MSQLYTLLSMKISDHNLITSTKSLFRDFLRILFPKCCPICHKALVDGEEFLCLECLWKIPRTDYQFKPENELIRKIVDIKAPIEKAAAFFFYKNNNPYSRLIRDAKYNDRPQINRLLARRYATELQSSGFFDDIDIIIPIPIHWLKKLRRGYNQTEYISHGLSDVTGITVAYNLRAAKRHKTQTHKTGKERQTTLQNIFVVDNPDELAGKHVLLVDDVITTGSTIVTCARVLHEAVADLKLSVLSLATTRLEM